MRVLQLSAELFPLLKTGGLADVAGALPAALRAEGAELRVLVPGFAPMRAALQDAVPLDGSLWRGRFEALPGTVVYVLDLPALFDRPGSPYGHADDLRRFARLGQAAVRLACGTDPDWQPQLLHAHDWHAALACAQLHAARAQGLSAVRSIYTVHNLAYQGLFPVADWAETGLPPPYYALRGLEFHGQISCMKAGLQFADAITTVSPSYAREIQQPEQGCGLDGLLRERAGVLQGILNGVDPAVWHPALDPHLAAPYRSGQWSGKARCKAALQQALGLTVDEGAPLFGVVSRLTEQKGLGLLLQALEKLLAGGGQLAVLGSGDAALREAFVQAVQTHPGRVALHEGFDEALAHRMVAGCDVMLVPSRFEPCGLTQLYALAYGTLPLVRRVGGLADTVVDCTLEDLAEDRATGFVFDAFEAEALQRALRRAFTLWRQPARWRQVQRRGMAQNFSWNSAARDYMQVYRQVRDRP